jgi:crotonobetainyl-CoA:carnitine CoA-transferase CaiB-like acyl-CoA transferase
MVSPVATIDEVVNSQQLAARDYFQRVEHSELNASFRYPGPFVKFSSAPIQYRHRPPTVGEHNQEIYCGELGMSNQEFTKLSQNGIV